MLTKCNKIIREIKKNPKLINKFLNVLKSEGVYNVLKKTYFYINKNRKIAGAYDEWIAKYDIITDLDVLEMEQLIKNFRETPLISIVMPTYNTNPQFLREAIVSVLEQSYPYWQLCIADDASTNFKTKEVIEELRGLDERINVVYRKENGHISLASNSALELVKGEFVALMDHDDKLPKHALFCVSLAINELGGEVDLIYTDEDKIDGKNNRYDPYFKSDWNTSLFYSQNFIAHLGVYRTSILKEIGGFRKGFEGSQDYDMALRFINKTTSERIHHIPMILYHWRIFTGNHTFSTDNQKTSDDSAYKAINEYWATVGDVVSVQPMEKFPGCWVTKRTIQNFPKVSLIIPTRDKVDVLKRCLEGVLNRTKYRNLEVIIVDNDSIEKETSAYFSKIAFDTRVKIIKLPGEFNYSKANNFAAKVAQGDYIGLLNNDVDIINKEWLKEMIAVFEQHNVGAVGAKLYYPNEKIQHAGVTLGIYGIASHSHRHYNHFDPGYFGQLVLERDVSAVTGACMVIPKDIFWAVGGLDEENLKVSYNDVDLCMKIRKCGYRIVFTPAVELVHFESISRGQDETFTQKELNRFERRVMFSRYGDKLRKDPYYNLNLSLENEDYTLAFPPRRGKPWRKRIEFVCPFHRGDVLLAVQVAAYYKSLGNDIRLHVSEELFSWVSDFPNDFCIETIPIGIPKAHETGEYFRCALAYVESREDSSGYIVKSHPSRNFDELSLNIVENMFIELGLPLNSIVANHVPVTNKNDFIDIKQKMNNYGDNIILLHPYGGWELKSIPSHIIDEIVLFLHKENFKVVQIGGSSDRKIESCDGWILENFSLRQWKTIFEMVEAIIGVDSWTSHFAAILDVNQIVMYGSTNARDVNSKRFFEKQDNKALILNTIVECSPCHSLTCKRGNLTCSGFRFDQGRVIKYLQEIRNKSGLSS